MTLAEIYARYYHKGRRYPSRLRTVQVDWLLDAVVTLARLASEAAQFSNPLAVVAAQTLRDQILLETQREAPP